MILKPADIIISMNKKSLFSIAILSVLRFFQSDPVNYQHSMMVVNDIKCIEANWKVEYNVIKERFNDFKRYKIIRHKNLTDEQRLAIVKRAETMLGKRYGVLRIILQLFDNMFSTNYFTRHIKDPDQQICSSLIAWSYDVETGIRFNNINWASIEPDDLDDESLRNPSDWKIIQEWERP